MLRSTLLQLGLIAGLLFALAVTSCGGGGKNSSGPTESAPTARATAAPTAQRPELQRYFEQVATLAADFQAKGQSLSDALDASLSEASDEEAIAAVVRFLTRAVTVFDNFSAGLDGIEPPAATAQAHGEAVAAGRESTAFLRTLLDQAKQAKTANDLQDVLKAIDAGSGELDRFGASCKQLQTIAGANKIDVDLLCKS